jgi:hypothetical protein
MPVNKPEPEGGGNLKLNSMYWVCFDMKSKYTKEYRCELVGGWVGRGSKRKETGDWR